MPIDLLEFITDSPIGRFWALFSEAGLRRLIIDDLRPVPETPSRSPRAIQLRDQLLGYFAGTTQVFDLPLDLADVEAFSASVLQALAKVPFGEVVSYKALAESVGEPHGAQAVGAVMASNPILIILPCHRVIASDGLLTGFSAPGGLNTKAWLLRFEGQNVFQNRVSDQQPSLFED